ncbi:MAG TPA: hypothetical protein VFT42_06015 [Solirubrobacteraceae bacterium]|nr:hypothetical protein [Solirubrobacteraceae bacterium]
MTRIERAAAARVIEWAVAPAPPLPPGGETDAVAAFSRQIAAGPPLNRLGLRAALLARAAGLPVGPVDRALQSLAHLCYYGDAGVMRLLGYAP